MTFRRFDDPAENVWKYVFEFEDAVAEAVLYRYESFETRTVLCISVQSGCPVGCLFCGTGKQFIRNLSAGEIVEQVITVFEDMSLVGINDRCAKLQIMFMSMGEPMLNWKNVAWATEALHLLYPNAQLLISTIGVDDDAVFGDLLRLAREIPTVGLQFSLHRATDVERSVLIPYAKKTPLRQLRDAGLLFWQTTGRPVYLNYCVDETHPVPHELITMKLLFSPLAFYFTFSVICSADETMRDSGYRNLDRLREVERHFLDFGYNTRIFDPKGQSTIGGGCGQLWYVQEWLRQRDSIM